MQFSKSISRSGRRFVVLAATLILAACSDESAPTGVQPAALDSWSPLPIARLSVIDPSAAVAGAMHTVVDDFGGTVLNEDRWAFYGSPSYVTQDDRLLVTLAPNVTNGYGGVQTREPRDFRESLFAAEASQVATGASNTETVVGVVSADHEEYVLVSSLAGRIGAYYKWRGKAWARIGGTITFDKTKHRFRRVRETAGRVFFELSADGVTWTQPTGWTMMHGFGDAGRLHGIITAGTWTADPAPGVAIYAGVNSFTPAIPAGLTATAVGSMRVDVRWLDRSANEAGFIVERRLFPDGEYVELVRTGPNVTVFSNTGLTPETGFEYRVRAWNASGESRYTAPAAVTTPPRGPAPSDPSGVNTRVVSSSRIDIRWTDNATNESGFEVQQRVGENWVLLATRPVNAASFSVLNLVEGTTYTFRVRAISVDNASGWSPEVSGTTLPATPTQLTAVATGPTQVTLAWAQTSAVTTGFEIQRRQGTLGFRTIARTGVTTAYVDPSVLSASSYEYRVRTLSAAGASSWTPGVIVTTP